MQRLLFVAASILMSPLSMMASQTHALTLQWPVSGVSGHDWVINNYVDLDRSSGLRDYQGGNKTYDNHNGVDIDIATFRGMDNNRAQVLAAADGVVSDVLNSNPDDRHIGSGCSGLWNAVYVRHPSGLTLMYGHLKYNSVTVAIGDAVAAGDVLGIVGSSGCSSQPHLHFEIRDANWTIIDPFQQDLWADTPAYQPPLTLMDYIIHEGEFPIDSQHTLIDPLPNLTHLTPGKRLVVGFHLAGGHSGDNYDVVLYDPNSQEVQHYAHTFSNTARHTWWYWFFNLDDALLGIWTVEIEINGIPQVSYDVVHDALTSRHVYQAEAASALQGGAIESNHNGFNGAGFANMSRDAGRLTWSEVDAGSGGSVLVALRYALGKNEPRRAQLIANGVSYQITFQPTGGWTRWRYVYKRVDLLDHPTNTIELRTKGQDSGNIDELVLAMQAEDAWVNDQAQIEDNHSGFRGAGFVNFKPTGGRIEWVDVDGRGGGEAQFAFRYALGAKAARTAKLYVNGVAQSMTFEPTGSWSTWSILRLRARLTPGPTNIVSIESQGEDAGNIDQLFVTN